MSTALNVQPAPLLLIPTANTQFLMTASAVGSDERVLVIGPNAFDHLMGLARNGCKSASAARRAALCRGEEDGADVIWLTGIDRIDADLTATVGHLDAPRIVVLELTRDCAKARLPNLLGTLRNKGLADQSIRKCGGCTVVVATRPAWLRRVI